MSKRAVTCLYSPEYEKQYRVHKASLDHHCFMYDEQVPFRLDDPFIESLRARYPYKDTSQFICAVRPAVVLELFRRGYDEVLFLGCDVVFYAAPWHLLLNKDENVIITPHTTTPYPEDGLHPSNEDLAHSGLLNSDIVVWRNCPEVIKFLEWQALMHQTKCIVTKSIFLDQTWLNFLPSMVDRVTILKDQRYNVAFFNHHERGLPMDMVCYQFTGYTGPSSLSRHQNRYQMTPALTELYLDYQRRLDNA